jgi:hypothetical protein
MKKQKVDGEVSSSEVELKSDSHSIPEKKRKLRGTVECSDKTVVVPLGEKGSKDVSRDKKKKSEAKDSERCVEDEDEAALEPRSKKNKKKTKDVKKVCVDEADGYGIGDAGSDGVSSKKKDKKYKKKSKDTGTGDTDIDSVSGSKKEKRKRKSKEEPCGFDGAGSTSSSVTSLKKEKKTKVHKSMHSLKQEKDNNVDGDTSLSETIIGKKQSGKKRKSKKLEVDASADDDDAESRINRAVDYLRKWQSDRSSWKFEKVKQIVLLNSMYDEKKVIIMIM